MTIELPITPSLIGKEYFWFFNGFLDVGNYQGRVVSGDLSLEVFSKIQPYVSRMERHMVLSVLDAGKYTIKAPICLKVDHDRFNRCEQPDASGDD